MTKVPAKLRREVIERAKGFCEYCYSNSVISDSPFDIEHIIPQSADGESKSENLALSCHGCNLHKSTKVKGFDIITDKEVRLFNPRTDNWKEHFTWAESFSVIVGLTPIGRATVEALNLNRIGSVNKRQVLFAFGKHPPKI